MLTIRAAGTKLNVWLSSLYRSYIRIVMSDSSHDPKRPQCIAEYEAMKPFLSLLLRRVGVSRGGELVRDRIAQVHQVIKALFQRIIRRCAICARFSAAELTQGTVYAANRGLPYVCIRTFILASDGCGME